MKTLPTCAAVLALALAACGGGKTPATIPADDLPGDPTPGGDTAITGEATPAPVAKGHPKDDLIPRAVLYGAPERTNAQISPDGKHLSWLAPVDGILNVFVAPV